MAPRRAALISVFPGRWDRRRRRWPPDRVPRARAPTLQGARAPHGVALALLPRRGVGQHVRHAVLWASTVGTLAVVLFALSASRNSTGPATSSVLGRWPSGLRR